MNLDGIKRRVECIRPELDIPLSEWAECINSLEKRIYKNIIQKHETDIIFKDRDLSDYSACDELIAPDEYADMYVYWVIAQHDLKRNETARYTNSMAVFNNVYNKYANYINREYMPVQKAKITVGGI